MSIADTRGTRPAQLPGKDPLAAADIECPFASLWQRSKKMRVVVEVVIPVGAVDRRRGLGARRGQRPRSFGRAVERVRLGHG